jgi:hypothetical protein
MRKDPVRFTSQWALIGVILFYTVGTAMIALHTKKIFKPASVGADEYSRIVWLQYEWGPFDEEDLPNYIPGFVPWGMDGYSLPLSDCTFDIRQFSKDSNIIDLSQCNTKKNNTQRRPVRVQTSFKCIESVLKQAVIIPYQVNNQIIGLQLNGLEKVSQAMAALLIKSGDVILAVNGKPLNSKKEAYKIMKKARKDPTMTVDILHDGEPKKIVLDLK